MVTDEWWCWWRRCCACKRSTPRPETLKEDRRHDLPRQIEQLDAQIDALVYESYGLTEEEIAVVGGQS